MKSCFWPESYGESKTGTVKLVINEYYEGKEFARLSSSHSCLYLHMQVNRLSGQLGLEPAYLDHDIEFACLSPILYLHVLVSTRWDKVAYSRKLHIQVDTIRRCIIDGSWDMIRPLHIWLDPAYLIGMQWQSATTCRSYRLWSLIVMFMQGCQPVVGIVGF